MAEPLPLPALHASHGGCWLRDASGATKGIGKGEAIMAAADTPLLMLNAPLVASRLGYPDLSGLDLLELFAFVYPARFMVPTPKGLAHALGLAEPAGDDAVPALLQVTAEVLLSACNADAWPMREGAWNALQSLTKLRWPWAALLNPRVRQPEKAERWLFARLPEWDETPERPQPAPITLEDDAVVARLAALTGSTAEIRPGQRAYAAESAHVFNPRRREELPHMLLAQAGTGIGKTLGYLAPASLWSQSSGGTVWVSTFTKALQRQLRRESRRAWEGVREDGSQPVVVRKGRENYL
jgi:ATP-dependent DNA helicase DinG